MSNKPKKLKRRATIHGLIGTSPTTLKPPIRIEDLVNLNNGNYCLNKSRKKSNLNAADDALDDEFYSNQQSGSIKMNNNLVKSFSNLYSTSSPTRDFLLLDDQLNPTLIRRRDRTQKKRFTHSVDVCYDEMNKFYSNNERQSNRSNQFNKNSDNDDVSDGEDENRLNDEFNQTNECFTRNRHNATVIQVNSSTALINGKVNSISEQNQQESNRKEIYNLESNETDPIEMNETTSSGSDQKKQANKHHFHQPVNSGQNKQNEIVSSKVLPKKIVNRTDRLENDLKIDKKTDFLVINERKRQQETKQNLSDDSGRTSSHKNVLKPEILKRKKSLTKQAKCE